MGRKRVIGRINGGGNNLPLIRPRIVDLGSLRPVDPIEDAVAKVNAEQTAKQQAEAWGEAFKANAAQGAASLLAFLMSGVTYGPDTVYRTATEIVAAMRAGGYLILKQGELQALIADGVKQYAAMSPEDRTALHKTLDEQQG